MAERRGLGLKGWLLLLVLLAGGAGVAGHLRPGLPFIGPLVQRIKGTPIVQKALEKASENRSFGVYALSVDEVAVDPNEFKDGESIDLQFHLEQINMNGETVATFDSKEYGENSLTQGRDALVARWPTRKLEVTWRKGDRFRITVRDAAFSGGDVCTWESDITKTIFPLEGTYTFDQVRARPPRTPGANRVTFSAQRLGPVPAEAK